MKILVLNCGSSSLKYQLIDMEGEKVLAKGLVERIGIEGSRIKHTKTGLDAVTREVPFPDHSAAIKYVLDILVDPELGVLKSLDELGATGHRIVHGGEKFTQSVLVTPEVVKGIEEVIPLAPLHNPANLMGLKAVMDVLPGKPNVVVFDTAFHQTMPPKAFIYGIPYEYYEKDRIRRYGFHGTSHGYVANRAAEILGKDIKDLKIVTCHLGNGSSITAVDGGKCVDTSMGLGTAEGLLMGTRSGNVDPLVVINLMEKLGDAQKVSDIIHKKSGLLGVSGVSSDLRDVEEAAEKGCERSKIAQDILITGVKKYIASYAARPASARTASPSARPSARIWNSWASSSTPKRTTAAAKRSSSARPTRRSPSWSSRQTKRWLSRATRRDAWRKPASKKCPNILNLLPKAGNAGSSWPPSRATARLTRTSSRCPSTGPSATGTRYTSRSLI